MSARLPHLPLEDSSSHWIIRLAQAVESSHKWYLETYQLTRAQLWTLLAIRHDAKQPVAIAKALGIDPAAVTRQVEQLVRKGYVRRTRSGVDRRALYVELTEKAERALPTLQSAAHRADRMLVDGLRPEEIRALQTAARRIIANARTMEPPDRPEGMPGED